MGEKRCRKAFTSIRRKPKLRRKSVKVECKGRQRTANTRRMHNNPQGNARERTRVLERGRNTFLRRQLSTRDSVSSAPALLCAFYKKIMRDLGGQRIDFCGHRAYNSIMAKGRNPTGIRQVSDRQEGEEETVWRRKSFVHLQYFWTWMAP